jgi:hypothetical protein
MAKMTKFRAKPVLIRAAQFNDPAAGNDAEAKRICRELNIDMGCVWGGSLYGWIDFAGGIYGDGGTLRPSMWLVRWPGGELSGMTDQQFRLMFASADQLDVPEREQTE